MIWIDEWLGGKCNETDYNELQSIFWCFNSFLANSGQSSICCTVGHRARDSQRKALQKEEAVASTGNWSRARLKVLDFCWVQEFPRTPVILISIWYFPGNCCQQELFKMISWINWILWWQKTDEENQLWWEKLARNCCLVGNWWQAAIDLKVSAQIVCADNNATDVSGWDSIEKIFSFAMFRE